MKDLESGNKVRRFLLIIEGVGSVFVGVFLAAYLGGLFLTPSTTVLHSEPAFRLTLSIVGIVLLLLILVGVVLAVYYRRK